MKTKKNNIKNGFSIIEIIAAIFIFSIVTITIYGSFKAGLQSLSQSKYRVAATELANEKMEIIRNMDYASVGTQGGVPNGILPQDETVWKSNLKFNAHTFIRYVDDPEDGVGDEDTNRVLTDYKEVKVEVTWAGVKPGHGVKILSKLVPNGVESDVGGGTLRFNALDGSGAGIPGVSTRIRNSSVNPAVDINTYTDSYGTILMSGLPAGDRNYEITVSKDGYESITTLPPYPITAFDPTDVHASVMAGDLNTKAIIIDKLSNIHVYARDFLDYEHLFSNIHFNMKGGRVIGLLYGTTTEVTSYDENLATGAGGDINVSDISPGKYNVVLNESGYTIIGTDPVLPLVVAPDQNIEANLILANNTANSLIVVVEDATTGSVIPNATVRLHNASGTDITLLTGQEGRVYFPPNTDPPTELTAGQYSLDVTETNHQDFTEEISINQLTQKEVSLQQITP